MMTMIDGWTVAAAIAAVGWLVLVLAGAGAVGALVWYAGQRRGVADADDGPSIRTTIEIGTMTGGDVAGIEDHDDSGG